MSAKERVVVAMSGGIDSSVAAGLLVQEGYEVVGITLKTHGFGEADGSNGGSCCSLEGINDARAIASRFGFPHYVLDFSERFGAEVIENFVGEYLRGRTPNPCVICNRRIKWEELLRKAAALGADRVATGHYARVRFDPRTGRHVLSRGRDGSKDQSYALWGLTQESLGKTLFPLAELTKPEVRVLGETFGFTNAQKGESYEICFIPDDDYERFLKQQIPDLAENVSGGELLMDGKVVGRHRGFPFYTIGQRRGLGVAVGEPVYVTGIDAGKNRVQLGTGTELYHTGLVAKDVNLIKYAACGESMTVQARIRYKDEGGEATVQDAGDGRVRVIFKEKRRAITPGQSVVFYEGDDVVGGGVIDEVIN